MDLQMGDVGLNILVVISLFNMLEEAEAIHL